MRDVRLSEEPIIPSVLIDSVGSAAGGAGATVSFTGAVRGGDGVEALELSHYEPLTLPGMNQLAETVCARFNLLGLVMVHRIGRMAPGDPIVCVAAAATHRRAAFEAVDFAMDHLKSAAWFWKRELRAGNWQWIEPRAEDHADRERWSENSQV
jgi:molybdopterin synthase catalytic subunit